MTDIETGIAILIGLGYLVYRWIPAVHDDRREE